MFFRPNNALLVAGTKPKSSGFSSQKAYAKYKKYRNKVTHLLEIHKKSYYQSQFLSCRNDSGKMWKLINSLISSKEKSSCPPEKLFDPINQTTQAIQKSCPIYSTPSLSQLDSNQQARFFPQFTMHIQ